MISLTEVEEFAKDYRVIPIVETLFSGTHTPLSIFQALAEDRPGSFLLESAEQGVWSRFSFIGVENLGLLSGSTQNFVWQSDADLLPSGTPELRGIPTLDLLNSVQAAWKSAPVTGLPPLVSGLVGILGWDTIHEIENLGQPKPKDFPSPDLAMAMLRDLVVLDHQESSIKIISNIYLHDGADPSEEHNQALERIAGMIKKLSEPSRNFLAEVSFDQSLEYESRTSKSQFLDSVEKAKEYVRVGDAFQVVLSQRFDMPLSASALDVYRMLRAVNPSPYMYLLNFADQDGLFQVVGSSPEALVKVSGRKAVLHPIAGSRPRGFSAEEDSNLASDLLNDQKERAEHLMLVDLARNDLLKVCIPGSVAVSEFMTIERYSHIMHLVSTVEGELNQSASAVDVVRATFPAGTLSGAPKPRALEIIEELEPANRGLFGGVVGYLDFAGNADLAIAIRTCFLRDGTGHVQAGAGIVLDSNPDSEFLETVSKASAPLRAIAAANTLKRYQ